MFGRELRLPLDILYGNPPSNTSSDVDFPNYVLQLQGKLVGIHQRVRERWHMKSDKMKSKFDLKTHMIHLQPGQKVRFYAPSRTRGKCPKLQRDWTKTYIIRSKLNDVVYRIQKLPHGKLKVVHVNRLWPLIDDPID